MRGSNVARPVMVVAHSSLERTCWLSRTKVACPVCKEGRMNTKKDDLGNVSKDDECNYCGQRFEYTDVKRLQADSRL